MNELTEGSIIVPYMKGHPIMLLDNHQQGSNDTFIRAQKHEATDTWYADIDQKAVDGVSLPNDPIASRLIGAIVFLTAQEIRAGFGVRITRVFRGGKSARGVLVKLPDNALYPYTRDAEQLFKPATKEQAT